ncbi:MAG TPA: hypothetical protein PK022_03755 [Syntrophales bacterium]|nr:hypothetical protein [Syntrophales bacterium]
MERRYACYADALVSSPDDFERVDEIIRTPEGDVVVRGQGKNEAPGSTADRDKGVNGKNLLDSLPFQSWLLDD